MDEKKCMNCPERHILLKNCWLERSWGMDENRGNSGKDSRKNPRVGVLFWWKQWNWGFISPTLRDINFSLRPQTAAAVDIWSQSSTQSHRGQARQQVHCGHPGPKLLSWSETCKLIADPLCQTLRQSVISNSFVAEADFSRRMSKGIRYILHRDFCERSDQKTLNTWSDSNFSIRDLHRKKTQNR
jgi:hypothetical protein